MSSAVSVASYISQRLDDIAMRTPRGNEIIRRDPREIPRRLRGLLLAIDGRQSVRTYISQLEGFGDMEALLSELATLGLIELKSAPRKKPARETADTAETADSEFDGQFGDSSLSGYQGVDFVLEDPVQVFQTFAETTVAGTFDDLVRVAQLADRSYRPPPPPPPGPTSDKVIQRQVESLFALLEAVRGERKALRERVAKLRKYRQRAETLSLQNNRLVNGMYMLAGTCIMLVAAVILMAMRR